MSADTTSALLVKRNREIAEVRDELVRTEAGLDALQAQNKELLESFSNLDSEVSRQCARAASAEAQIAELETALRGREEDLAVQQDAHEAAASVLHRQLAVWEEETIRAESEGVGEERRAGKLAGDLSELRQESGAESDSLERLRHARQELGRAAPESDRAVQSAELQLLLSALDGRAAAARCESGAAKLRIETIRAELSSEQLRRDELGRSLREAMAEQASGPARLRSLEGQLAASGGDPSVVVAALWAAVEGGAAVLHGAGDETAEVAAKATQLRAELKAAEDNCRELKASLDRKRAQQAQAADGLQDELDKTRGDLQKILHQAVSASNAEVQHLENEVALSEARSMDEVLAERACSEKVARLKEERSEIMSQQDSALNKSQVDAGRCGLLGEEFRHARAKVEDAEQQTAVFRARVTEDEAERRRVAVAGNARAAKIRGMIEDLWQGIHSQASRADVAVSPVS